MWNRWRRHGSGIGCSCSPDIVGDTRAAVVNSDDWATTFEALTGAGFVVTLAGRTVRVVKPDTESLRAALADAGITASISSVPATIEERMTLSG